MKKNYLGLLFLLVIASSFAEAAPGKKQKVVYKKHTELDFTGEKIEGKVKAPAVFYIFQRKRSVGHEVSRSPSSLHFHDTPMKEILKDSLRE